MTSISLTLKSCVESNISVFRENDFLPATFLHERFREFEGEKIYFFSLYIKGGV
jgi:hypothetical protein